MSIIKNSLSNFLYACGVENCEWVFKNKSKLESHVLNKHNPSKPFACQHPNCGKKFKTKFNLKHHTKKVHSSNENYKCPFQDCQSSFHNERSLRSHLYDAHNFEPKNFVCDTFSCGRAFSTLAALVSHKKTHENDLTCQICSKEFTTPCRLRSHILSHKGDLPYSCPHRDCDKSFVTPSKLARHEKTHEKSVPVRLACTFPSCQRTFVRQDLMKQHLKTHLQKTHPCPFSTCHKNFISSGELQQHVDKNHPPAADEQSGLQSGACDGSARTSITHSEYLRDKEKTDDVREQLSVPSTSSEPPSDPVPPSLQDELIAQELFLMESSQFSSVQHSTINLRDLE